MAKKKVAPKKKTGKNNKVNNKTVTKSTIKNKSTKRNVKKTTSKSVKKEVSKSIKILKKVIALLIVCVVLYFVYINFIVVKDNIPKEGNIGTSEIEELAKQKFSLFSSKHNVNNNDSLIFTNKDLDVNSMDNKDILYFAYSMMSLEDKDVDKECDGKKDCYKETFDKKVLEEQVKNYFNINDVKHEDFNATSSLKCTLNNEKYECVLGNTNYGISPYNTITNYVSSKLSGEKLIVRSSLLTIRRNKDNDYTEGIYMDSKATKKIDDLNYFLGNLQGLINTDTSEKLGKKYDKEITHYETTYVLKNKNYVWQSTKIVK